MTHNQVDTETAARKRQEIGLSPRRATAEGMVARPPDTHAFSSLGPWLWVGLVATIAIFTLALVVARFTSKPATTVAALQEPLFAGANGSVLVRNEFTSEDGPLVRDFQPRQWSMGTVASEGVYRIRMSPSVIAWSTLGAGNLEGFRLSTSMQVARETPWGYSGVIGRYTSDRDLYLVEVDGAGRFRFQVQSNGEWTTLQDWMESALIKPAGYWNNVAVEDSGGSVVVTVGGQEIFRTQAVWLRPGDAGVVAGSMEPAVAEANFDWITLEQVQ